MGFFDQGGGYDPITGAELNPNVNPLPVSENFNDPNAADSGGWGKLNQIFQSLGVKPSDIGNLVSGTNSQGGNQGLLPPPPAPRVGGIGSDANAPMPAQIPGLSGPPLSLGNDTITPDVAAGGMTPGGVATPPVPPQQPPQTAQFVGPVSGGPAAPQQPFKPVGPPLPTTFQNGQNVPTFPGGPPAAGPAPLPPGAPGSPMNIIPPGANQQKQNFLQSLITGGRPSGTLGAQQIMAGIGKGLSNIKGNGRFASAARGFGQGVEGANEQQKVQFQQASQDFNNSVKMLLTGSTLQKNAALNHLYQVREQYLQTGKGSNAWQTTDYGKMVQADRVADTHYNREMISLDKRANTMNVEDYNREKQKVKDETAQLRQQKYKEYGVHPDTTPGVKPNNPIETSKFKNKPGTPEYEKEFNEKVPPGAFFVMPGEKKADGTPNVRIRPPQEPAPASSALSATAPQRDEVQDDTA